MARSRRSSPTTSTARKSAPTPAPASAKTAPAPAPSAPSAPASGGGMLGGLMGTVADGFAWGTGTNIARRAVDAAIESFSGSDAKEAPAPIAAAPAAAAAPASQANVCMNDQKAFLDCLNINKNDISACQFYLDAFNQCKQQATYLYTSYLTRQC